MSKQARKPIKSVNYVGADGISISDFQLVSFRSTSTVWSVQDTEVIEQEHPDLPTAYARIQGTVHDLLPHRWQSTTASNL